MKNLWTDYQILATGDGLKLERWGDFYLLRPDPQVIWPQKFDLSSHPSLDAKYTRIGGGGKWEIIKKLPEKWTISWQDLTFEIKPMGFKHTGLFPEQATNWQKMMEIISKEKQNRESIKVLNLFAYTGGATVACTKAGAVVTHVDSAKNMVEVAKTNMKLSGLDALPVRYIVDDCKKFVQREIRRGNKYDAVIMDPPSYGRGPTGEMWKIEENLFELVSLCSELLSDNPLFFLINSYTTGLQPTVIGNVISRAVGVKKNDTLLTYELTLPTDENIPLPCGCSGLLIFDGK